MMYSTATVSGAVDRDISSSSSHRDVQSRRQLRRMTIVTRPTHTYITIRRTDYSNSLIIDIWQLVEAAALVSLSTAKSSRLEAGYIPQLCR